MAAIKLPAEMIAELKVQQRNLHDILSELDKFERCGGDCQQYRIEVQNSMDRVARMLQEYGGN